MRAIAIALVLATSAGMALTQAYSVEPVNQAWSGMADPEDGVSQIITCNFDSLGHPGHVELFAGDACAMGMQA